MNLETARRFQVNLVYNYSFKKTLRQRSYHVYLHHNSGYLPELKTLQKWRKRLFYASVLCLTPICLGTVISLPLTYSDLFYLGPELTGFTSPSIIFGSLFIILVSFSAMFDWVIHRRFPSKAILDW